MNHEPQPDKQAHPVAERTKPSRFRIVKLEERIAPGNGSGNGSNATCGNAATCHKCFGFSLAGGYYPCL